MRIGITGTIGSGKSTVTNYLKQKGYAVFDCDESNSRLLNNRGYELLHPFFSECFEGKELNKQALANTIFNNETRKKQLESILHPLILKEMLSIEDDPLICEVPLLFEVNWENYFDYVVLVVSDEDICLSRLLERGINNEEAMRRIKNQMAVSEKIKKAHRIIYNNGSLDDLYQEIDNLIKDKLC